MDIVNKRDLKTEPFAFLFDYQREIVGMKSRFIAANWCRQSGKDFTFSGKLVAAAYRNPGSGHMIAAPSERQSLDTLEKCKTWVEAFELAIADITDAPASDESPQLLAKTIRLSNGSVIRAVPGKPDTVRGFSGSVWLTEVAFFEHPRATWAAILPTISSVISGEKTAAVWSTPNGQDDFFYPIFRDAALGKKTIWATCTRDIYAVAASQRAAGYPPIDIEGLRAAIGDADMWAQEYECQFLDTSSVLFPYELLSSCESAEATTEMDYDALDATDRIFYCGVDIGRKKDLTVVWILEKLGDVAWTRAVVELDRTKFRVQREFLCSLLRRRALRHCAIDATGIGMQLAEELADEFGEWRVSSCTFSADLKQEIFLGLRRVMEDRLLRTPADATIREDVHRIKKITTSAGTVRIVAEHTEDGHSDRGTALALANYAARAGATGATTVREVDIVSEFRETNPYAAWRRI